MNFKNKFKQFLYLYNFDMRKSLATFCGLFIGLILYRISNFVLICYSFNSGFIEYMKLKNATLERYLSIYGSLTMSNFYEGYLIERNILMPLLICIIFLALYSINIWLREWNGNNRTIYTLMTLPISRATILLSKFATCFSIFIIFYATQILVLFIEKGIFNMIIPKEIRIKESILEVILKTGENSVLLISGKDVIFAILAVSVVILLSFSLVLLVKSFGKRSIFFIIALGIVLGVLVMIPDIIGFYAGERLLYYVVYLITIVGSGFLGCKYLLEKVAHV